MVKKIIFVLLALLTIYFLIVFVESRKVKSGFNKVNKEVIVKPINK